METRVRIVKVNADVVEMIAETLHQYNDGPRWEPGYPVCIPASKARPGWVVGHTFTPTGHDTQSWLAAVAAAAEETAVRDLAAAQADEERLRKVAEAESELDRWSDAAYAARMAAGKAQTARENAERALRVINPEFGVYWTRERIAAALPASTGGTLRSRAQDKDYERG